MIGWLCVSLLLSASAALPAHSFQPSDIPYSASPVLPDAPSASLRSTPIYDRPILNPKESVTITPGEKFKLAVEDVVDPSNLIVIVGDSAIRIGANAHSAYGPGMRGFGLKAGYSLAQAATGEFIGTFAIASLVREDPHYHRLPTAGTLRRLVHAISRTVIAEHDDGSSMLNYEILATYPSCEVISNRYVPGLSTSAGSTAQRVLLDYGTDPIGNIVNEFLPDVAGHVHLRIAFAQNMIDQLATGQPVTSSVALGCVS
jgi:hypothetical protein